MSISVNHVDQYAEGDFSMRARWPIMEGQMTLETHLADRRLPISNYQGF
jgi:hypothetical protein